MEFNFEETPREGVLAKIDTFIWEGLDHKNMLHHAFHTVPEKLNSIRKVSLFIHLGIIAWVFLSIPTYLLSNKTDLILNISIWGLFMNIAYLGGVFLFKHAEPSSLTWKFTYIFGELAAALGFLIFCLFFGFLIPNILASDSTDLNVLGFFLQLALHVVCPVLIWIDVYHNYFTFPQIHIRCLLITLILYGSISFTWAFFHEHAYYPGVDWKSLGSHLLTGIGMVVIFVGYMLGNLQYKWKMRRESQGIAETLQLNEVSSPTKLSNYHPIDYDI